MTRLCCERTSDKKYSWLKSSEFQVPYNIFSEGRKNSSEIWIKKEHLSIKSRLPSILIFDFTGFHLVYGEMSVRGLLYLIRKVFSENSGQNFWFLTSPQWPSKKPMETNLLTQPTKACQLKLGHMNITSVYWWKFIVEIHWQTYFRMPKSFRWLQLSFLLLVTCPVEYRQYHHKQLLTCCPPLLSPS